MSLAYSRDMAVPSAPASLYRRVGDRIGVLRRARGWTQEQLAEEIGVDPSYVARIEVGKRKATLDTLYAIAAALGGELATILGQARADAPLSPRLIEDLRLLSPEDRILVGRLVRRLAESRLPRTAEAPDASEGRSDQPAGDDKSVSSSRVRRKRRQG